MSSTYEKIATTTLASNQGTVTFSSIPTTYTDLRLIIRCGIVDNGFLLGVRVGNGSVDSGTNYSWTYLEGDGSSSAYSNRKSNMSLGALSNGFGNNNLNNIFITDFQNYSNTTTNKTWIGRMGSSNQTSAIVNLWRSTSAINTIAIAESGDGGSGSFNYGNMLSGSTFTLYGIKAE
jgi:hypothetical protein